MERCQVCRAEQVKVLVDFGPQPLCNRFKTVPHEEDFRHPLILGQCQRCGLIQLTYPVPAEEIIPRVEWLKYNEPEGHLDHLADVLCSLEGFPEKPVACGITYKDDSLLRRLSENGFEKTWRIDPKDDLGINQKGIAGETVIPRLTANSVRSLVQKYGPADVIVARHVLEHAPNTQQFLSIIGDLLAPDGLIAFEVPDCTKQLKFKDYSMVWEEHILYFVPETLKATFSYASYDLVRYLKYPYITEDSQIAIVRKVQNKGKTESKTIPGIHALGEEYAVDYEKIRKRIYSYLKDYVSKGGKVAFYGAGHLSVMLVNFLGIEDFIEFVADDTEQKQGFYLPGTSLKLEPSETLEKEKISLCVLCMSVEYENKIMQRHQSFVAGGGTFLSAFPMQENSLLKFAMRFQT